MSTRENTGIVGDNSLPEGWKWATLGDVSEKSQYGWTTKANHDTGRLKLLRTTDITSGSIDWSSVPYCTDEPEDVEKYLLESGDVLISRAGSVGVSFLINKPERAVFASYLIRFRPKKEILTKYFYYYLKSPAYWDAIGESKSGIAVPNVNASKLSQVPIPVAPLDQQKRIVAEIEKQFSRLDEAVANLKRVKANLKRYRAAVLKTAVEGRLVETEAELAAQGRANVAGGTTPGATTHREGHSYESGAQLLQRILETRRSQWKGKGKYKEPAAPDTTDLPELPEGWVWTTVEQMGDVQLGKMLDRQKHRAGNELPYLRNINVRWGSVDTDDLLMMFFKDSELDRYGLQVGDVLVCEGGEPGRAAVWDGKISGMMYQKAIHRVRFLAGYEQKLLVLLLEYLAKSGRLERWFTGSTIKHFTRESFSQLPIPLPPHNEQRHIITEVEERLSNITALETQVDANIARADRLRQSILSRAFTGALVANYPTVTGRAGVRVAY